MKRIIFLVSSFLVLVLQQTSACKNGACTCAGNARYAMSPFYQQPQTVYLPAPSPAPVVQLAAPTSYYVPPTQSMDYTSYSEPASAMRSMSSPHYMYGARSYSSLPHYRSLGYMPRSYTPRFRPSYRRSYGGHQSYPYDCNY
ncbi:uncharacterized protein LOC106656198 [Trichogramma pretiosum]|uniref:uncharacterized protein LOC106656198 n=1 Tax=Trichogramma pretiosum TaxID=7493 RepID=UPI0006C974F0|nr:uncharacterized protein LOC106656198 [Trichogramma pretiosum]